MTLKYTVEFKHNHEDFGWDEAASFNDYLPARAYYQEMIKDRPNGSYRLLLSGVLVEHIENASHTPIFTK